MATGVAENGPIFTVPSGVLGRTNRSFPDVWLRPCGPAAASCGGEGIAELASAAKDSGLPLDVTTGPALWGGYIRGAEGVLICVGAGDYERAVDARHAGELIDAHLIETLSCLGRDYLDFYFLRVRGPVEEFRIAGALEALEMARQEGHIRHIGLACDGNAASTLAAWRFHDAFEVLMASLDRLPEFASLAAERRVGTIGLGEDVAGRSSPPPNVRLVPVHSAVDVERILVSARSERSSAK